MKKCIFSTLIIAMFVLTSVACKSTPKPEEEPPKASASVQQAKTTPDALKEIIAKVEEARKRAQDFESPSYFPSDWEKAEADYTTANNLPKSTESEIQRAAESYNALVNTYDGLFKKTIPLYAQAREDEITAARDELITSGFTREFPQYLQKADRIALKALEQYEAEDYYTARDTAAAAMDEYETLLIGSKAFVTRREIIDRGFSSYDNENFIRADEIGDTAIEKYEAGDKKAAADHAEEALLRYNLVLTNAWTAYAAEKRDFANYERENAITNKVNIAVRDAFRNADEIFNQAEESYKAEKFENAAIKYVEAEALFVVAGQETEEKRQRAMETIKMAEEKIEESVETAAEAERIIEGGSR